MPRKSKDVIRCAGFKAYRCGHCPYIHFVGFFAGPMFGPIGGGWWSALGPTGES